MENEKQKSQKEIEEEKLKYQDEPFYYVESAETRPFPPFFWLQWGLLSVICFFFASIIVGGFGDMHRYGIEPESGRNNIFLINKTEKIFYAALLLCLPGAVFLSLFFESVGDRLLALLGRLASPENGKKVVAGMMLFVAAATLFSVLAVTRQSPTADDDNVYLFQTRILATGYLTLPSKPGDDRLFEDNIFLVNNGKVFGQYPFGQSILLLPGVLLGFPHLSQILLAVFTVLGAFMLGREIYGHRAGLIAALLISVSPAFLFTSATLLAHLSTLFFLTWFGYFAVKTIREQRLVFAVLCGLAFGVAFQVRGATTLLVGFPAALALIFFMFKDFRKNLGKIICLAVTVGLSGALFLFLNWYVNGNPLHTNYHAAWLGVTEFESPFGFGKGAWKIIHTPTQGILNAINNLVKLNAWLFGWPIGLLFVIVWAIQKGRKWVDILFLAPIPITFIGYFFYFWPGISDTGPVLYFELLLPVALLSARGIEKAPDLLSRYMDKSSAAKRTTWFVAVSILLSFFTFHFYNAKALSRIPGNVQEIYKEMKVPAGEKAVVFSDYYIKEVGQKSWVAGRKNTHPALGDTVIYALDFGRDMDEEFLRKYYPDFKGYVFHYIEDKPRFIPLSEYEVSNYLKNYPDSR